MHSQSRHSLLTTSKFLCLCSQSEQMLLRTGALSSTSGVLLKNQKRGLSTPTPVARGVRDKRRQPIIGVRRETVNAWERRAPLAPKHVRKLIERGIGVHIQPSNRRAFPIQDYIAAGAQPKDDLSNADVIMSVKSVPIEDLIPNKTYAFFSHTIKAQKENMPLLDAILANNIQLMDYEKMTDENGRRLVMFGKWAGYAGMIDLLHGLGLRLLALGHHTPFLHIGLAHNYRDSHMAVNALRDCGYEIAMGNMPESLGPLIFVFTGQGNVSQGAQELMQHLPHEYVTVDMLPSVAQRGSLDKVYGCVVKMRDHLVRKEGGPVDTQEFFEFPERYDSLFSKKVAPYASVIMNCIFWGPTHPRLLTIPDAKHLLTPKPKFTPDVPGQPTLPHRLIAICDISADPGGSIEFMRECTTIDKPFVIYDADQNKSSTDAGFDPPTGCLVCSIDNMPAQMPLEATTYFGDLLMPYIGELIKLNPNSDWESNDCSPVIRNAVITHKGKLTPNFEYIGELRQQSILSQREEKKAARLAAQAKAAAANGDPTSTSASKTSQITTDHQHSVLLLGAGMVSGPVVNYFGQKRGVSVTAASALQGDLERLAQLGPHVSPVVCDVQTDRGNLEQLIREHNVVISLLPYTLHSMVAKMCIDNHTDMVTSSYLSPELKALHGPAQDAGVTIMNECGLDPGIDHMLAMECINDTHEKDGKVISFISYCGGLPAPECSDNALRYKFSWSPRGVLMAAMNPAKHVRDGKVIEIPPGESMDNWEPIDFMPGFSLIGYPNRDSTKYLEEYNIPECKTILRGTLRYHGFIEAIRGLRKLGFLSDEATSAFDPNSGPHPTWKELLARSLHQKTDIFPDSLRNLVTEKLGGKDYFDEFKALDALGLFRDDSVVNRKGNPLDTMVSHLEKELTYLPGERDVVILCHKILVQTFQGDMFEHRIELVDYGEPNGYSAMARTVGYTAAITADMILNSEIQRKGMVLPLSKDIYRPALQRLSQFGIKARTTVRAVPSN